MNLRSSWLGGRTPLARVAATRRMSGQLRTITSSRTVLPVNPVRGFGNAPGLEDVEPFRRQVPNERDEPVAEQGYDGEDMVGAAARVGTLLAEAPTGPGHRQPVEDIGGFVDRGRDCLRCEGSELVREVGIGLEARFAAIAGVDQVHCFALVRGRKELAVAGGGEALAPEPAVSSWHVPFLCCPVVSAGGALSVRGSPSGRRNLST